MEENHMITLKTHIEKNMVTYKWNNRLRGIKGNHLYFIFEADLRGVPEHVFNFMFGVFMMDSLAYTGDNLWLTELTEAEELHLNNILRMNHDSNGCAGRGYSFGNAYHDAPQAYAKDQPTAIPPSNDKEVVCANGLGKDGINVALLAKEMGYIPFCYTLINQYWRDKKLWPERYDSIMDFYHREDIDQTFIKTNFFKIRKNPIAFYPYAVGLPLAYLRNTNVILDGIQIHNNKTRISDGSFYCPGETYVVFNEVTKATGITLSSPLRSISNYGSQKLLADKWPQYLKYQRSCMFGRPWCGSCPKCNRKALYQEVLGIDHVPMGLPRFSYEKLKLGSYGPVNDSVRQIVSKLRENPYNAWVEGANENALDMIWNGDKLREILSDHFHLYREDPGPDGEGYTLEPSKWREYKDARPDN